MRAGLVALLAFLALAAVSVHAQSADAELRSPRDIGMVLTSTSVNLVSRTRNPAFRNRFEVEYKGMPDNQFTLQTRAWSNDAASGVAAGTKFDLRFRRLTEYLEVDGIPGYTAGDTRRSPSPFNIGHVTFTQDPNTTDSNGNVIYNFHGQTAEATPVFKIIGKMLSVQSTVDGVVIIPSSHKFDLQLTPNWPIQAGSRLALECFIDISTSTQATPVNGTAGEVSTVHLGDNATPAAAFTWVPTVTVNGNETADIIVGPFITPTDAGDALDDPNQNRKLLTFSVDYVGATSIWWDPSVEIGAGSVDLGGSSTGFNFGHAQASTSVSTAVLAAGALVIALLV